MDDELLMLPPSSTAPYTTMLKELTETIILVSSDLVPSLEKNTAIAQYMPKFKDDIGLYSAYIISDLLTLLQQECKVQLALQNNELAEYNKTTLKEKMKEETNVIQINKNKKKTDSSNDDDLPPGAA